MQIGDRAAEREARLHDAWDEYASLARQANDTFDDASATGDDRFRTFRAAQVAHEKFNRLFLEPTPAELEAESMKLTVEAFGLGALLMGFVGVFLPDLEANFSPLAITLLITAGLGGWTIHFLRRLAKHIGRRL